MESEAISPTHRALHIPEIVEQIFQTMRTRIMQEESYPWWNPSYSAPSIRFARVSALNQATLAKSARTCRRFADPALDALWETVESLVPLLRIVGLKNSEEEGVLGMEDGKSDLTSWLRLERYAQRIRHLVCSDAEPFSQSVPARVLHGIQDKPLLPRLKTLIHWYPPHLFLLASPNLRRIHLSGFFDPEVWSQFVDALSTAAPPLDGFLSVHQRIPPRVSELHQLRALRIYNIFSLTRQQIASLLSIQSLKVLEIHFVRSNHRLPSPRDLPRYPLRSLKISIHSELSIDVLAHFLATPLKILEIYSGYSMRTQHDRDLCQKAMAYIPSWSSSLTYVRIQNLWPNDGKSPTHNVAVLHPLLELKWLQCLVVVSTIYLDPSNEDYYTMMRSWPTIRCLHLDFRLHMLSVQPRATLHVLESLAKSCPDLRHLTVYLDHSTIPPSPSPEMIHFLDTIYIPGKISCDTVALAEYLCNLFPRLCALIDEVFLETDISRDEDWLNLVRALKSHRSLRFAEAKAISYTHPQ